MASAIAWKNATICVRCVVSSLLRAKPKNSANTTSGSIALCAAAAIALLGMIAVNASAQPVGAVAVAVPAAACRAASSAGSRGTIDNASGAMIAVNTAHAVSTSRNTTIDRRATRPDAAASLARVDADDHQRQHQRHHGHLQRIEPELADGLRDVGDAHGQRRIGPCQGQPDQGAQAKSR